MPETGKPVEVRAVILAGGRGRRLAPYSSVLPKPLMPIGDRAILEVLVSQLVGHGFERITLCVGYLAHLIRAVFDGHYRGPATVDYVYEVEPLGTAGPLTLVEGLEHTFLVMNGDLLTDIDFRVLVDHHRRAGNAVTIATHERESTVDYGVLHLRDDPPHGARVVGYEEKPSARLDVSMGIYVMEPRVVEVIPRGEYFDFPQLVERLLVSGERVGAFPYDGLWLDIGRRDDYERALAAWEDASGSA